MKATLKERYPLAFGQGKKPLAIGTLDALIGAGFDERQVRNFLKHYTGRLGYLKAVAEGKPRVNLAGDEVAIPTDTEREYSAEAARKIEEMVAKAKAETSAQTKEEVA